MKLFLDLLNSSTVGVLEGTFRSGLQLSEFKEGQDTDAIKEYPDEEIIFARKHTELLGILKFSELKSINTIAEDEQHATIELEEFSIFLQFIGDSATGRFYAYIDSYKTVRDRIE